MDLRLLPVLRLVVTIIANNYDLKQFFLLLIGMTFKFISNGSLICSACCQMNILFKLSFASPPTQVIGVEVRVRVSSERNN